MELESSLISIKCLGFVRMVCKFKVFNYFFSNFEPTCSSIWTVPLRAHIGKDRKEEKFDIFQYLSNPGQRSDVLCELLRNPDGRLVCHWNLDGHGDDTEEGFLKISKSHN